MSSWGVGEHERGQGERAQQRPRGRRLGEPKGIDSQSIWSGSRAAVAGVADVAVMAGVAG